MEKEHQLHMLRYTLTEQVVHGMEVSNLAYDVGRELGLSEEMCHELAVAGIVHDIGKIPLSGYVEGDDTLVVEEMRFVRMHAQLSYELLKDRGYSDFILQAILYHHENADGSGFFKKNAEETPLMAQMIHLADLLGHSSLEVTRIYTSDGINEWRKDLEKMNLIEIEI